MSLRLYMDHHVDAAITRGLQRRGIDVLERFSFDRGGPPEMGDRHLEDSEPVPHFLTRQTQEKTALTCLDDGTATWDDERLLERATALGRALFTQDDDHLAIAHRWLMDRHDFAGLIFAHPLAISIGQAIRDLDLLANAYDEVDIHNRVEYLPL